MCETYLGKFPVFPLPGKVNIQIPCSPRAVATLNIPDKIFTIVLSFGQSRMTIFTSILRMSMDRTERKKKICRKKSDNRVVGYRYNFLASDAIFELVTT